MSSFSLTSVICSSAWEKLSISSLTQDKFDKFSHTDEQIKLVKENLVKEKLLVCTWLYAACTTRYVYSYSVKYSTGESSSQENVPDAEVLVNLEDSIPK